MSRRYDASTVTAAREEYLEAGPEEAARRLGVSATTVRKWAELYDWPAPRSVAVTDELDDWRPPEGRGWDDGMTLVGCALAVKLALELGQQDKAGQALLDLHERSGALLLARMTHQPEG